MKIIACMAALMAVPAIATAQTQLVKMQCSPYEEVAAFLRDKHGEKVIMTSNAAGVLSINDTLKEGAIAITASADSYTVVFMENNSNLACILAVGKDISAYKSGTAM